MITIMIITIVIIVVIIMIIIIATIIIMIIMYKLIDYISNNNYYNYDKKINSKNHNHHHYDDNNKYDKNNNCNYINNDNDQYFINIHTLGFWANKLRFQLLAPRSFKRMFRNLFLHMYDNSNTRTTRSESITTIFSIITYNITNGDKCTW